MTPSIFALVVAIWGALTNRTGTLRMQVLLLVLGGTTAILFPALGGATVVVPTFALAFLVPRALAESRERSMGGLASAPTFLLGFTALWGACLAILVPRALAGTMMVMAISRSGGDDSFTFVPLGPVSGNITQTVYAFGSVAAFAATRTLLRREDAPAVFIKAVITVSLINCLAGAMTIIEFYTGIPSVLDFFRTAYVVTHQSLGFMPRIHGTFSETSSYSMFSLGLFGFTAQLALEPFRPRYAQLAAVGLLAFLLLSTSGTAYGGLALYGPILLYSVLRRAQTVSFASRFSWVIAAMPLLLGAVAMLVMIESPIVTSVVDFFDITVFGKFSSDSGVERSSWNSQGLQNFVDSWGIGVGFGTVRTSSFVVTLLSNLGIVGTSSYVGFLYFVLVPKPDARTGHEPVLNRAARHAVLAHLSAAVLSSTAFDQGAGFYVFAAAASLVMTTQARHWSAQAEKP